MKAADLDDQAMLSTVADLCAQRGMWANTTIVAARYPDVPYKVVAAKLAKLLRRHLVSGCACGCRGDWELTQAGREFIETAHTTGHTEAREPA